MKVPNLSISPRTRWQHAPGDSWFGSMPISLSVALTLKWLSSLVRLGDKSPVIYMYNKFKWIITISNYGNIEVQTASIGNRASIAVNLRLSLLNVFSWYQYWIVIQQLNSLIWCKCDYVSEVIDWLIEYCWLIEGCPDGKYGINCAFDCLCHNGGTCQVFDGECKCPSGWTGPICTESKYKHYRPIQARKCWAPPWVAGHCWGVQRHKKIVFLFTFYGNWMSSSTIYEIFLAWMLDIQRDTFLIHF